MNGRDWYDHAVSIGNDALAASEYQLALLLAHKEEKHRNIIRGDLGNTPLNVPLHTIPLNTSEAARAFA